MNIPSYILLPLCIGSAYVFSKGVLCCVFDIAIWAQRREENQVEPQIPNETSALKTALFWFAIAVMGIAMWKFVQEFDLQWVLVKTLVAVACLFVLGFGGSYCWSRLASRRERNGDA